MPPREKTPGAIDAERLVDEAIEETFPASDPISPGVGPGEPIPNRGDRPAPRDKAKSKPNKRARD